jgi:hypothetical protein
MDGPRCDRRGVAPGLRLARGTPAAPGVPVRATLHMAGGFFIPIIFGHLVPRTSFGAGWVFLAIVSFAFALIGLAGRNPVPAQVNSGRLEW